MTAAIKENPDSPKRSSRSNTVRYMKDYSTKRHKVDSYSPIDDPFTIDKITGEIVPKSKTEGGYVMDDKYVTKSEFEIQNQLFDSKLGRIEDKIENLDGKITSKLDAQNQITASMFEHLEDKISSKLDMQNQVMTEKLGSITTDIEKSIKLALYEKEEQNRKDRKETNRYIFGTLLIGSIGIIVGVIGLFK